MTDVDLSDLLSQNQVPQVATEEKSKELSDKMEEIGLKSLEQVAEAKAVQLSLPYINLKGFPISTEAIGLISQERSEGLKVICFFYSGSELRLGSQNPQNPQIKNLATELAAKYKSNVEIYLISEASFNLAYGLYDKIPKIKEAVKGVEITEADINKYQIGLESFEQLQSHIDQVNITEMVSVMIAAALKTDSSDIHIEAEEKDIKVRFRIDGVLHTVAKIDNDKWTRIISRIKLISGLKLNITDRPQDGRFTIYLKSDRVDVRVSTVPTAFGESVVMRLLRSSSAGLDFERLGLRCKSFVDLKHEIERPNGMIISTGPTGSGKTTTLYSILTKLNKPETKIITLEDPIEYRLEGINQSQIEHGKDYNFAKGLKSVLRQDPDVVMVGEIRDLETADVTINAALTGHLVISTIHTNSASGAIPRFLAMGVKPFLLAPALNAVIGQRLVRKICPNCKTEAEIDSDTMGKILKILSTIPVRSAEKLEKEELNNLKFFKGTGCESCHHLGYQGRIGIFEIMIMSPSIEKNILSGKVSEYEIQELAVAEGMVTMVQDGLLKAKDGITSIEEIFRVAE